MTLNIWFFIIAVPAILAVNIQEYYPVNLTQLGLSTQSIQTGNVGYYSGYTAITNTTTYPKRQLHQVFVENNNNIGNQSFPIFVLPMGYYTGVSSLYSLFNEFGAFTFSDQFQTQSQLSSLPYGLQYNPNHLATQAHLLFIDPIPGVGLSYWAQTPPANYTPSDDSVVSDLYQILTSFSGQGGYPNSTYYLLGNGYSARISVLLAKGWSTSLPSVKLGGLLLSNPLFQLYSSQTSLTPSEINNIEFLNNHNFLGDAVYSSLGACQSSFTNSICTWGADQLDQIVAHLNMFNIYNYCFDDGVTPKQMGGCLSNTGLYNLVNNQYFKSAFYSNPNSTASTNFLNIFNTVILSQYINDYTNNVFTSLNNLITANVANTIKICIFNGDVSLINSITDTNYYLNQMNLLVQNNQPFQQLLTARYAQPIGLQLAGVYTQYQGLLYAQIKKGGFLCAKDKPQSTLALVKFYLTGAIEQ